MASGSSPYRSAQRRRSPQNRAYTHGFLIEVHGAGERENRLGDARAEDHGPRRPRIPVAGEIKELREERRTEPLALPVGRPVRALDVAAVACGGRPARMSFSRDRPTLSSALRTTVGALRRSP